MKKLVVCLALFYAAAAPTLHAQGASKPPEQPPTVTSVLNTLYGVVEQQVVSAAEAMPEDKYGFAPTNGEFKGVRTFAEEVKHIGFANHLFFGPLMGETIDTKNIQQEANGPAELSQPQPIQPFTPRFAVPVTPLECALTSKHRVLTGFGRNCRPASHLESALAERGSRNSFRMRTYEKKGGWSLIRIWCFR